MIFQMEKPKIFDELLSLKKECDLQCTRLCCVTITREAMDALKKFFRAVSEDDDDISYLFGIELRVY